MSAVRGKSVKKRLKTEYYSILCKTLNPRGTFLDPYKDQSIKKALTCLLGKEGVSAVRLIIYGKVKGVGFEGWFERRARKEGIFCRTGLLDGKHLEAILIGDPQRLADVQRSAWAGAHRSQVLKVTDQWFNKPVLDTGGSTGEDDGQQMVSWSSKTADLISATLKELKEEKGILDNPNVYEKEGFLNTSVDIKRVLEKYNVFTMEYSRSNYMESPKERIGMQQAISSKTPKFLDTLVNHKHLVKEILTARGIRVPVGECFTELEEAKAFLQRTEHSLVVKPADGKQGQGITVGVNNKKELEVAWQFAKKYHEEVVLEELIYGVDLRIYVIEGRAVSVLLRIPAHVIGDGRQTVARLIDDKNEIRALNPHVRKKLMVPDVSSEQTLACQGYTMDSIPGEGEVVFLHLKANVGAGGEGIGVTDETHDDIKKLAVDAAETLGLSEYCGIDLLLENIDLPLSEQTYSIVEVNTKANMFMARFPMYGRPVDVTEERIKAFFPEEIKDGDYPTVTKKVVIKGNPKEKTLKDAEKLMEEYGIEGTLRKDSEVIRGEITGKIHRVKGFADTLWETKRDTEDFVDGIELKDEAISGRGEKILPEGTKEKDRSREEVFTALGYQASYPYKDVVRLQGEKTFGITGLNQSTIFSDQACEKWVLGRKILSYEGIRVPRGRRFKVAKYQEAKSYFKKHLKQCRLTFVEPHRFHLNDEGLFSVEIRDEKDLKKHWKNGMKQGINLMLLEELFDGEVFRLSVLDGKVIVPRDQGEIHEGFYGIASKAVKAFPGLDFAEVRIRTGAPGKPAKDSLWVVEGIQTDMKDRYQGLMAGYLCQSDRTLWVETL